MKRSHNYDITASIVVYNTKIKALQRAIDSFLNSRLNIKLFIIDNSPNDRLFSICRDKRIEYVFNNMNVGFGAGHNIAIRRAFKQTKYHLIMNPDIFFEPFVLEKLFIHMKKNNDIGLIMPKICYLDGSTQYLCKLLPSPTDLILRRSNVSVLIKLFKSQLDRYEFRFTDYNQIMEVPHLSGCFMFVRGEIFTKVGFFDERFFMYLEDVDFSRRIHKHYKTVYFPELHVYHEYDKGSYKNITQLKYHLLSGIKYFNKWGWFFDKERGRINNNTLKQFKFTNHKW